MQRTALFAAQLALACALAACGGLAPPELSATTEGKPLEHLEAEGVPAQAGALMGSGSLQTSDGSDHSYFFRIPAGPEPAAGRPVLLWLHGDGQTGAGFGAGFHPYTDADGAILVTPSGSNQTWTHAASDLPGQPQDAQFLSLLIDQLLAGAVGGAAVDPRRIYLGGESRGAFMPYYLLMRASTRDRLAAVASNAGALYCQEGDAECLHDAFGPIHSARAAMLHLHGTDDHEVPAPTAQFHTPIDWDVDSKVFSPLKFWALQNGCFGGDNATGKDDGVLIESFTLSGHPAARYDLSAWGEACRKYQLLLVSDGGHVIQQQHARIWQFLSGYDLDGPRVVEPTPKPAPVPLPAAQERPQGNSSLGFFVTGGRLYDSSGQDFVLRGVNLPLAWYPDQSLAWLDQIALTGANAVRLVWTTDSPAPVLRAAITRAIELRLIPMIELHDVTGGTDVDQPRQMADYYANALPDLLLEFEQHLLLNIANEWSGPDESYVDAYGPAITLLRDAGLHHTLVIDANEWGQGNASLLTHGPELLQADPQHNLLFSLHMYHDQFSTPQSVLGALNAASQASLPFIVGEFGSTPELAKGGSGLIPVPTLLEESARLKLGVLAWVWTGYGSQAGSMDLSTDGSVAQLTPYGQEVVDGPFGLRATSRAASVFGEP